MRGALLQILEFGVLGSIISKFTPMVYNDKTNKTESIVELRKYMF